MIRYIADLDDIAGLLKNEFVGKDEMIEMIILCAIAKEHLLIVGPPGTAKSDIIKRFAIKCNVKNKYFEYLLTQFTEPNEIFGPIDVKRFQEGQGYERITQNMLPDSEIVFLDEVFKANSAILNALLPILNERIFYNGGVETETNLMFAIGATNEVPKDPELDALFDRFLIRLRTDQVEEERFFELIQLGWNLEKERILKGYKMKQEPVMSTDHIACIHRALNDVDLKPIHNHYREVIRRIRSEGIHLSDRRVIKLLKIIGASALRNRRPHAELSDFWILRHVWNQPEQIPMLDDILTPYMSEQPIIANRGARDMKEIQQDVDNLKQTLETLSSDIDFVDFLKQLERYRKEINRSDEKEAKQSLLDEVNQMIHTVYDRIDKK